MIFMIDSYMFRIYLQVQLFTEPIKYHALAISTVQLTCYPIFQLILEWVVRMYHVSTPHIHAAPRLTSRHLHPAPGEDDYRNSLIKSITGRMTSLILISGMLIAYHRVKYIFLAFKILQSHQS